MARPDSAPKFTYNFREIIKDTGKAVHIRLLIPDKEVWLPSSKIKIDLENKTVTIPEWLKKEKGI
jgi:hypothetical protein